MSLDDFSKKNEEDEPGYKAYVNSCIQGLLKVHYSLFIHCGFSENQECLGLAVKIRDSRETETTRYFI